MKWKPEIIIEGVHMPIPDDFQQSIADLCSEDSKRTMTGIAIKKVIAVKCTFPLKWEGIEWEKAAELTKAIDGKSKLTVQAMDVRNPYAMTTFEIYVNDRTCKPSKFSDDGKVYWDIEFKEIET